MAISNSGPGSRLESASGFAITDPSGWSIGRFLCADLAGDHRPEMIVLLATGRDEAFLFIFRPVNGQWHLSYAKTSGLPYIWGLAVRGRTLIEKRPFFGTY